MHFFKGLIVMALAVCLASCQKDTPPETPVEEPPVVNPPVNPEPADSSRRLSYGDSLFFLPGNVPSYFIEPVSKPAASGYFKAIPAGLSIDTVNGRINVLASETGMRFKIYYVSAAGIRLDSTKLVISGIDYRDSIFQINQTLIPYDTAFPVYNARFDLPLPCTDGDDDDDDDGNECIFDETDLDNDGDDDIDGVIQEKLLIDPRRGFIDVEASFRAGIFGSDPANGVNKDFEIFYRLRDASNMALNRITVRVFHFKTMNDIPAELLEELDIRRGLLAQASSRPSIDPDRNGSLVSRDFFFENRSRRPPIIVIISQ